MSRSATLRLVEDETGDEISADLATTGLIVEKAETDWAKAMIRNKATDFIVKYMLSKPKEVFGML